ncbi:unknown [Brachyspira sp. CAG:484]|nr:unknown [Brachyspira sp. CAG:484]
MIKYAKVINEEVGLVAVGIGADREYYKSIGFTEQEVVQSDIDGNWYLAGYAPMKTEEEKAELTKQNRISEIKQELNELDKKRIRAMCEPSEYAKGVSWLEYYNQQAQSLRAELQEAESCGL